MIYPIDPALNVATHDIGTSISPSVLMRTIDIGYRRFCKRRGLPLVDDMRTQIRMEAEAAVQERMAND